VRLLIVEDDLRLSDVLRRGLSDHGHVVDVALDGDEGAQWGRGAAYDAIVLDLNLPRRDGLTVLRGLRAESITTPVLILTSRDTSDDVVEGLDAGADDYLRKPFVFSELQARLRALVRRDTRTHVESELIAGDLRFDLRSRRASRGGRDLRLTLRESIFFEFFMRHQGELIRRKSLEDAVLSRESEVVSNVIDVYVGRLRAKLVTSGEAQVLRTVRGHGFLFEPR
jgi:DNA-binding response OmpR family regulator